MLIEMRNNTKHSNKKVKNNILVRFFIKKFPQF